jgi:hypothetical protein
VAGHLIQAHDLTATTRQLPLVPVLVGASSMAATLQHLRHKHNLAATQWAQRQSAHRQPAHNQPTPSLSPQSERLIPRASTCQHSQAMHALRGTHPLPGVGSRVLGPQHIATVFLFITCNRHSIHNVCSRAHARVRVPTGNVPSGDRRAAQSATSRNTCSSQVGTTRTPHPCCAPVLA